MRVSSSSLRRLQRSLYQSSKKVSYHSSIFRCNVPKEEVPIDPTSGMPEDQILVTQELIDTPTEKVKDIAKKILDLNMMEAMSFFDIIYRKMGTTMENEISFMGGGGGTAAASASGAEAGSDGAAEVEKTAFQVHLKSIDPKSKLKIIKEVRAVTSLPLKETKALIESAPCNLGDEMKKEDAEKFMNTLKELGADVELK